MNHLTVDSVLGFDLRGKSMRKLHVFIVVSFRKNEMINMQFLRNLHVSVLWDFNALLI